MSYEKNMTLEQTSFQKPKISIPSYINLLQVCPSVPTFVFAILLIPFFNILTFCFVSLNLVAEPTVRI